jgi:hypothetical protein
MRRPSIRSPPFKPARNRGSESRLAQFVFEKLECLSLTRLLKFIPIDPIFTIHFAALTRFPDMEGDESPFPDLCEVQRYREPQIEAKSRPLNEGLHHTDAFFNI